MVAEGHRLYTADEFENFIRQPEQEGRSFELIQGEIIEKMPTQLHGLIAGLITTFMNLFLLKNPLGWVLVEARYKLPDDEQNDYIPDVSFVSKDKGALVEKGPAPYMPDIAVEIKSPDETLPDMRRKAAYYLEHGTQLVWLVYTERRLVIVLTADTEDILSVNDTLDGGSVLPGFTLPVRDIFPKEVAEN
jgi:Uma2 family endonuclease